MNPRTTIPAVCKVEDKPGSLVIGRDPIWPLRCEHKAVGSAINCGQTHGEAIRHSYMIQLTATKSRCRG